MHTFGRDFHTHEPFTLTALNLGWKVFFREAREQQDGLPNPKGDANCTAYSHIWAMCWNWTPQCSSKVSFSACKRSAREPCGAQRNLTLCNSILPTLRSGVYVLVKERFFFLGLARQVRIQQQNVDTGGKKKPEANKPQDFFPLCMSSIRLICFIYRHSRSSTTTQGSQDCSFLKTPLLHSTASWQTVTQQEYGETRGFTFSGNGR